MSSCTRRQLGRCMEPELRRRRRSCLDGVRPHCYGASSSSPCFGQAFEHAGARGAACRAAPICHQAPEGKVVPVTTNQPCITVMTSCNEAPGERLVAALDRHLLDRNSMLPMRAIKPGAIGAEVYEAGLQVVCKCRYADHLEFLVHGIGLVSHELPRLTNR